MPNLSLSFFRIRTRMYYNNTTCTEIFFHLAATAASSFSRSSDIITERRVRVLTMCILKSVPRGRREKEPRISGMHARLHTRAEYLHIGFALMALWFCQWRFEGWISAPFAVLRSVACVICLILLSCTYLYSHENRV